MNTLSCSLSKPKYPVDDEAAFASAMEKRLKKRGMDVLTTGSGEEALQKFKKERMLDVVVPNLKMPRMLGIEVLGEIKKLNPLLSVIVLTDHGSVDTAVDGMRTGVFDYVTRPCHFDELTEKIERTRDKKKSDQHDVLTQAGRELRRNRGVSRFMSGFFTYCKTPVRDRS